MTFPKTFPFNITDHLNNDEKIFGVLAEDAAISNVADFIHTLNIAKRTKGITDVVKQAEVTEPAFTNHSL